MERLTLRKCNLIKVLMMISVIICHAFSIFGGDWFIPKYPAQTSDILGRISGYLGTFHIYVFVFISGFIFYFTTFERENGSNKTFLQYTCHRAKRLLLPYAFVALLWVAPIYVYFYQNGVVDFWQLFLDYVLAISPSQLWFLWMMFDVCVLFRLIANYLQRSPSWKGLIISLAFYAISIVGEYFLLNVFQIWTALRYFIFFYLGFAMKKYGFEFLYKVPWIIYFVAHLGLYVVSIYIPTSNTIIKMLKLYVLNNVVIVLGIIMVVIGIGKINTDRIQNTKLFTFLDKYNFGMYLFHQQIIYFAIALLDGVVPNVVAGIIYFIVSSVLSAGITYLISLIKPVGQILGTRK